MEAMAQNLTLETARSYLNIIASKPIFERVYGALSAFNLTVIALLFTVATIVVTRLLSASAVEERDKDGSYLPRISHWVPWLGNLPSVIIQGDRFFDKRSKQHPRGYTVNFMGMTHNVIWDPSMATKVFSQRPLIFDRDSIIRFFLGVVGGLPAHLERKTMAYYHELDTKYVHLLRDPELSRSISKYVRGLEESIPNLVSFNGSMVDQSSWERSADVKVTSSMGTSGNYVEEVSLLPLIINFVGHLSIPSIFGTDMLQNYPNLLDDLWDYNKSFFLLALGLPRILQPFIPKLWRGFLGRRRIIKALIDQQKAIDIWMAGGDPDPGWANLGDVSALILERNKIYRNREIVAEGRVELSIMWALNANSNFAVFWVLMRILSKPGLVERVRKEIDIYVKVDRGQAIGFGGITEMPRVKIDEKALLSSARLLKACFIESMRLDSATWSLKKVAKGFSIPVAHNTAVPNDRSPDATLETKSSEEKVDQISFRANTYISIPMAQHFMDPSAFRDPDEFIPERHLVSDDSEMPVEWKTIRPFGGGSSVCKGRLYAEREVLATVAALLALWDFEPVGNRGWILPGHGRATGVSMPVGDVRVRVTQRQL